jgi:hypothetical protein
MGLITKDVWSEDLSLREENKNGNFEETGRVDDSKVSDEFEKCNSSATIILQEILLESLNWNKNSNRGKFSGLANPCCH